jgi:hypothetical protein
MHAKLLRKFTKLAARHVKFFPGKTIGLTAWSCQDRKYRAGPDPDTQFPQEPRPQRVKYGSESGLIGIDPPLEYDKNLIARLRVSPDKIAIPTYCGRPDDEDATSAGLGCNGRFASFGCFQQRNAEMLANQKIGNPPLNGAVARLLLGRRPGGHLPAQ